MTLITFFGIHAKVLLMTLNGTRFRSSSLLPGIKPTQAPFSFIFFMRAARWLSQNPPNSAKTRMLKVNWVNCFLSLKFRHSNHLHSDALLMTDHRLQIRGKGIFLTRQRMTETFRNNGLQHGSFNLRPAGGCLNTPPPLRFFADSKKTAARSAAGLSPTLSPIFWQLVYLFILFIWH